MSDHNRLGARILLSTIACALLLGGGCAARPAPPQQNQLASALSSPERSGPPVYLPATARELLRARMANHTRDMSELVSAIMVLDYPLIESRARGISDDVTFSRPLTGDATELNSALPESFFDRQTALHADARALADHAHARDARRVAADYGHLAESCVSCHADFRPGR